MYLSVFWYRKIQQVCFVFFFVINYQIIELRIFYFQFCSKCSESFKLQGNNKMCL